MIKPLIITGYPRGGTSLVATIFMKCGDFWVGSCGHAESNGEKYPDCENKHLKKFFRKTCTGDPNSGGLNGSDPDFMSRVEDVCRADGYSSGPWLIKCGAAHVWPFVEAGCTIVFVDRDLESVKQHNIAPRRIRTCRVIRNFFSLTADESFLLKFFAVDYDELIEGEYRSLYPPFEHEDIYFDLPLIHSCIKPNLCHYRKGKYGSGTFRHLHTGDMEEVSSENHPPEL